MTSASCPSKCSCFPSMFSLFPLPGLECGHGAVRWKTIGANSSEPERKANWSRWQSHPTGLGPLMTTEQSQLPILSYKIREKKISKIFKPLSSGSFFCSGYSLIMATTSGGVLSCRVFFAENKIHAD